MVESEEGRVEHSFDVNVHNCKDPTCQLPARHEGNCSTTPPTIIDYRNHKGNRRIRRVSPTGTIKFMSVPPWHMKPQWVFGAIDHEDGRHKWFACSGLFKWDEDAK